MKTFFQRLFKRSTVENRLLIFLMPVTIILIILDDNIDQFIKLDNQVIFISAIKFVFAVPVVFLVIFFLAKFLDHKLSKTRIALQSSEERFRSIFENNSSGILIIQRDSTITMVNDAYCQMSGYTHQEVEGKSWKMLIPESELVRMAEFNRLRFQQDSDVPNVYEFQFNKKNGEIRVGLMSVYFDKLLNQIVASVTDITERKEMEISLSESRERYRKLVELQGEGLGIVDKNEIFLFSNPAADRIMGVPIGSLKGRKIGEFVSDSTLIEIQRQTVIKAEGDQSTFEMEITRPDREKRILLVTATPTYNAKGDFESTLGIFLDITDRKNIENELKKNEAELKALNTTKDKLFSIIAHDLRGPVGTSADLLEVMIDSYDNLSSDEQLKMLEILKNSAKSTFNLLETLLNWSIIQTGNIVFKPELLNLTECISSIVENMVPTAFSKNISLFFEPSQDIFAYADQNMIQTTFRNLIGNAIKFTFRGGAVEIKVSNEEQGAKISISDNGVGMDEETRKNLFVLNKLYSKYGTENEKGTGLGLILCKEFIEKHGGHILVESEIGKGSTFIFYIPKIYKQGELPVEKRRDENSEPKKFDNELILVVEDEDINYQVLRSILSSLNLKCDRAINGKEAVDKFLHNNYRLILMDIQMSEMNGWEATMKIRENDSEIPIIAVTAFASEPSRRKSVEAGCNDFITKPINKIKLIQLIEKYLQKTRVSSTLMSKG